VGRFIPVSRIELKGEVVTLIDRSSGRDTVRVEGRYDEGVIRIPLRGAGVDFRKIGGDSSSPFYPRGKRGERYRYAVPPQLDDGWPVAAVEDAHISREGIEKFVQMIIDLRMDSLSTSQIHSLLIARHGKLVLEEYFHGFH